MNKQTKAADSAASNGNAARSGRLTSPGPARLIVILAVLGVSFSAIFVRYSTAPSMTLAMLRMAMTVVLLLPSMIRTGGRELVSSSKKSKLLGAAAGVCLGLHFLTYFESIKNTTLASGLVLVNTEVFFVAVFLLIFYKEKLGALSIVGVLLAFGGGVLVAGGDLAFNSETLYGNIMAILSAICLSCYTLLGREMRSSVSATVVSFMAYLGAAVTLGIIMAATGAKLSDITGRDLLCALGMAVCCTLLGHSVFIWALKYVPTPFVSTAKLLEPVFSSIWGVFLFDEIPAVHQIAGGLVLITGVAIYAFSSEKDKAKRDAEAEAASSPNS